MRKSLGELITWMYRMDRWVQDMRGRVCDDRRINRWIESLVGRWVGRQANEQGDCKRGGHVNRRTDG